MTGAVISMIIVVIDVCNIDSDWYVQFVVLSIIVVFVTMCGFWFVS